ncbi:hypothetical protein [Bdellovibrio sp. GT3]
MNKFEIFQSISYSRRGAFAHGVQRELDDNCIPQEIKDLLKTKSTSNSGK